MAKRPIVLTFENVDFSYDTLPVLHEASFHIHQGEFIGFVGPNGSGKSTLLKLILGLLSPTGGTIELFDSSVKEGRDKVGYVPQHANYDPTFPISVEEVVRMGRIKPLRRSYSKEDYSAVEEALSTVQLLDLAKRPYRALSGGQRQRVLVARALSSSPKMLILDEPTANMDAESEKRLFDALGKLKGDTTILIVTHDTGFVSSLTDRVFCVGDMGRGNKLVQHKVEPTSEAPTQLFGGEALKVLHDSEIDSNSCCDETEVV